MISIIIPVYNSNKTISKTIDSVKNQSFKNFEAIIINDGSTDNSIKIINEKIKNDNRFILIDQSNYGVSAARNVGIKKSRYNYIAFLDADDEWDNKYLEIISLSIKEYPNYVGYGTYYRRILKYGSEDLKITERFEENKYISLSSVVTHLINGDLPFFTSSIVIKKDTLFHAGLFNKEINCGEDILTWIKVSTLGKIIIYAKNCVNYNITIQSNGLSRRKNDKNDFFRKEIINMSDILTRTQIKKLLSAWHYARYLNSLVTQKRFINLMNILSEYINMIFADSLNLKRYFTLFLIITPSKLIDKLILYRK